MTAGAAWLLAVWSARRIADSRRLLVWIVFLGAVLRGLMFLSTPILEDDFYRYLWDGGVTARGMNPYSHAPSEPGPALAELREEAGVVAARVNYPELRTIYPPVAQAFFTLAHAMGPWSLGAWRFVLLAADIAVLGLLMALLRALRLPLVLIVIYWWNPLVIKETFNAAHVDLLAVPFALGALLLAIRRRTVLAASVLALGVGVKLWPILLLPVVLRPVLAERRKVVSAALVFSGMLALMSAPVLLAGFDETSGALQYLRRWEMNDALFMSVRAVARWALGAIGCDVRQTPLVARGLVALILAVFAVRVLLPPVKSGLDLCGRGLLLLAALFLLSPAQFPWYTIMFIPLLALRPRWSLLLLIALLPLYYLRFYFVAQGNVALFDYGVVWVEYVPVWLLMLAEWHRSRNQRESVLEETA
jgi:hypothetical protein